MSAHLERTKTLIQETLDESKPAETLIHILESAIELVQIPDNNFSWTGWASSEEATREICELKLAFESGVLSSQRKIGFLFAPTGPIQELSISSGWGNLFLKVAEKYTQVAPLLEEG